MIKNARIETIVFISFPTKVIQCKLPVKAAFIIA